MTPPLLRLPASTCAVFVLLAVGLAACGAGDGTPSPAAETPAPTPAATASPSAAPPTPAATTTPSAPAGRPDLAAVRIALEPVVEGLDSPLGVAHAGDGSGRLFVVEQGGRIRIVADGALLPTPFLDIADRVEAGGERGLLGLAFHPDFAQDPRFFVDYTDTEGDTVVAEYGVTSPDVDVADPASERILLRIDQPYANHNGGAVAFGPDGHLYVAMGDGGSAGDPEDRAERLDSPLGKILRIDVDGADGDRPYRVPADNPFTDEPDAVPEIAHLGLRNPWRMAFDRATGDLWIGDVGQGEREEVDVARAGELGLDFAWDRLEGTLCYEPAEGCDPAGAVEPVAEYGHDQGCAVVGGPVYRGAAMASLVGGVLFADYCSGLLWAIDAAGPTGQEPVLLAETGRTVSALGEDEAGEAYLTDLSDGVLLRLVPAG